MEICSVTFMQVGLSALILKCKDLGIYIIISIHLRYSRGSQTGLGEKALLRPSIRSTSRLLEALVEKTSRSRHEEE